nr:MAG TPA: hypothetical protein [Caudoviricetes sp.]DAT88180.1 MAG TPA: hypothetical protein [Caudoviricetes sp.]DAY38934.1 MAG TPA: hypothetical protein [Caudoviricetes sp.]
MRKSRNGWIKKIDFLRKCAIIYTIIEYYHSPKTTNGN